MVTRTLVPWPVLALASCALGTAPAIDTRTAPAERSAAVAAEPVAPSPPPAVDAKAPCPARRVLPLEPYTPELRPDQVKIAWPEVPPLVDTSKGALDRFQERLAALARGRAKEPVRIGIYGDSNMTRDQITGWFRRVMQARYGDGGHGFVAATRPWNWYLHTDVKHDASSNTWVSYAVSIKPAPDGFYGFAGIAAHSLQTGAVSYVATADASAPVGRTAGRFDVYYLKHPRFGSFALRVDGEERARVDARADAPAPGVFRLDVPDGPHRLEVVAVTDHQPVRLFGVALERKDPGFVVDSLGVGGASCPLLLLQQRDMMVQTLRLRGYDMVGFLLGSNYSMHSVLPECMRELISRVRDALPKATILLFSPPDQGDASREKSLALPAKAGEIMRQIARDNDAVFWDLRAAMGGDGSAVRFEKIGLLAHDLTHFTDNGTRFVATRLAHAIERDAARHATANPSAGCAGKDP